MVRSAGLRRPSFQNGNPAGFARGIDDVLRFLQKLPFCDGVKFEAMDFGSDATSTKIYQLQHALDRKAHGVIILDCTCKSSSTATPEGYPSHAATLDDTDTANVCLSANQANNFIWSFWVW